MLKVTEFNAFSQILIDIYLLFLAFIFNPMEGFEAVVFRQSDVLQLQEGGNFETQNCPPALARS